MTRLLTFSAVITLWAMHSNVAQAVTVQKPTDPNVLGGRSFLWLEAESYLTLNDTNVIGDGFLEVSKETPIVSDVGINILPASSNVSGTALIDTPGGAYSHNDSVTWEVQFMTAGTYQFVPRISVFESGLTTGNYGNEDSFFLPPTFNKNSALDWVGYEKEHYNASNPDVELTDSGFALDPLGWLTNAGNELYKETGDSIHDGRYEILDWGIKSKGELDFSANDASPNPRRDGNFVWYEKPMMNNYDSTNTWIDDFGFRATYEVTPEQVGQVLTFELGARETYATLDGILFIESPDNDLLDLFTQEEVDVVLIDDPVVLPGDFDGSGAVGNDDLTLLLDAWGGAPGAGWTNSPPATVGNDSLTNLLDDWGMSSSLAAVSVPEPSCLAIAMLATMSGLALRRRS